MARREGGRPSPPLAAQQAYGLRSPQLRSNYWSDTQIFFSSKWRCDFLGFCENIRTYFYQPNLFSGSQVATGPGRPTRLSGSPEGVPVPTRISQQPRPRGRPEPCRCNNQESWAAGRTAAPGTGVTSSFSDPSSTAPSYLRRHLPVTGGTPAKATSSHTEPWGRARGSTQGQNLLLFFN